jgi:hypothetical protein
MIHLEIHDNAIFPFASLKGTRNNRGRTIEHGMPKPAHVRPRLCSSPISSAFQ